MAKNKNERLIQYKYLSLTAVLWVWKQVKQINPRFTVQVLLGCYSVSTGKSLKTFWSVVMSSSSGSSDLLLGVRTWADHHPWSKCGMTSNFKENTRAAGLLHYMPDIWGWTQKSATIISKFTANCGGVRILAVPKTTAVLWRGLGDTQRQAGELISGPCLGAKAKFLSFDRTQSRAVTGLLTGQNTLRRHLHLLGLSDSPLCKCGAEEETSAHILCGCKGSASLRHVYLASFFLEPEDIKGRCTHSMPVPCPAPTVPWLSWKSAW